jgi:hypothetical protein
VCGGWGYIQVSDLRAIMALLFYNPVVSSPVVGYSLKNVYEVEKKKILLLFFIRIYSLFRLRKI